MTAVQSDRSGYVHEPLTDQLLDERFPFEDPFPLYARLRAENPVAWNATLGFWVASRHAEVMAVSTDPATWCSGKGILTFEIGVDYPSPPTMMHTDPPAHTRYRSLVQPAFGRKVVRTLEDMVRSAAASLVAELPKDSPVDVVEHLAVPLPVQVIGMLLGLPESEWDKVWAWSEASIPGTDIWNDPDRREALRAEMMAELARAVAAGREHPRDDVISQLGAVELDGDRLSDEELAMFLNQLLVAGNETTRNTISGGLVAFAEHPDQWDRLRADRSLVAPAVEEILRWTTAVIYFMRTATTDTELGGQAIAAGDPVVMLYASANRDDAEFGPDAEQFRIDRSPNHHVAFGFGAHFCLGAALARVEVAAVLDALLDAGVTGLDLAGAVGHSRSNIIAGVTSAPMVLRTT
jgi:cytochrome P450